MNTKYKKFKSILYRNRTNRQYLGDYLKIEHSFKEQKYILNKLPKMYESLIFGTPFFNSLSELGKKKLDYFSSIETELNWFVNLFKKYSNEINLFIECKNIYETNFLLGNYSQSKETLNEIKDITHSYWGLENDFLQIQYEKGLEFNFKLLNKSKTEKVSDPVFYYLAHFFSYKVEMDISYFGYINSIDNVLNDIPSHYHPYFSYRLNSINYDYQTLDNLLSVTSNLSLIDKYIVYKDIVASILSNQTNEESYYFILEHCEYLSNCIDDTFFINANFLTSRKSEILKKVPTEETKLIDLFTKGKYEDVILNSKKVFFKNVSFSSIEIYVKSHIHLGKELQNIGNNKSLLNIILRLTYNILLRNKGSNEALIEFLTIANAISSFEIVKDLIVFFSYHFNVEENRVNCTKSYLFSKNNNPLHFEIFRNIDLKKSYLQKMSENNSVTFKFFNGIISEDKTKNIDIPDYRQSFYIGRNYFKIGDYQSCKLEIGKIIGKFKKIAYLEEQCLKLLFFSFIELLEYDNAIDLYVDNYISNPLIVSKINAKKLSTKIVRSKWKNISLSNINFPIFIYLAHSETHPQYIAYDMYMRTQKILKPSDLHKIEGIELVKKIFFLKTVANLKIVSRKAIVFKNSTAVLKERISICQILSKIDEKNIEEYSEEISEITQRLNVQQRIKEIDESKIYIDEIGILEKELNEVQKGFNRFKSISQLLKESKIDATGIGYYALVELMIGKIDSETYRKSLRKTDIHFELFTQLFLEIRDKFLFSNQYGLDYYLSQRIRHGTIINQLRKSFKTHNLVTKKSSKNDEYLPNVYWVNNLNLKKESKIIFVERLNLFSSNIDNIISSLKNKFIQIKTEDQKTNQTGWFEYTHNAKGNTNVLYSLFIKELQFFTDFDDFVKSIFDILWLITERNLELVRQKLDLEIKHKLIVELDTLEVDLNNIIPTREGSSLFRSIAKCRTNIQADVDYVITWFNKSKNNEIDFTFEDALNTSLQIVHNIASPNTLEIQTHNNASKDLIKGQYFTHFVDLIKIFLTNIYDYYSKSDVKNRQTKIVASQKDDVLILEFCNSLQEREDIEKLKSIIQKKQDVEDKQVKGIRGEGSTGFPKAKNILRNVFRDNNKLIFDINEEKFIVKCEILLKNLKV